MPQAGPMNYVKYNLTVKTDCYFYGDKGLLDDNNPCTYRGIIGHDSVLILVVVNFVETRHSRLVLKRLSEMA